MNKELLKKSQSLIALLLLCIVISILSDKFLSANNIWNVLRQISVNVCISTGMTLVVLMAGIDLSVGSVLAFTSVICAGLLKDGITIEALNIHVGFTIFGGILAEYDM